MIYTIPYIQERFDKYNALCFGSKLPPVPLRLSRARTFLGKCEYKKKRGTFGFRGECTDFVLKFSTSFDLPEEELDDVIIHEMIHYYVGYFRIKDTSAHGPVFRSYMSDINNRFGRHITVSKKVKPTTPQPLRSVNGKVYHVCVSQLANGERGVTVCASTRIAYINRMLPRYYNLVKKTWYISSNPVFGRFPRSIKARIYKISAADLDAALAQSQLFKLP